MQELKRAMIVTGLHHENPQSVEMLMLRLAANCFAKYESLPMSVYRFGWKDPASFGPYIINYNRYCSRVSQLAEISNGVGVIGVSAGLVPALTSLAEGMPVERIVGVLGWRASNPAVSAEAKIKFEQLAKPNPRFREAVDRLHEVGEQMTGEELNRVLAYYSDTDEIIPRQARTVRGARDNINIGHWEHVLGVVVALMTPRYRHITAEFLKQRD